jgi:hypothetical protein
MIKKQGELSLTVVIIAVICLIVLVVLVLIFSGKLRLFGSQVRNCQTAGGSCETGCEPNETPLSGTNCEEVCCIDAWDSGTDDMD